MRFLNKPEVHEYLDRFYGPDIDDINNPEFDRAEIKEDIDALDMDGLVEEIIDELYWDVEVSRPDVVSMVQDWLMMLRIRYG